MARRSVARKGLPLEWICEEQNILVATTTNTIESIDLDLLPDELAEIWAIDSTIEYQVDQTQAFADGSLEAGMLLSLDPSNSLDALTEANNRSLEVFFDHAYKLELISSATASEVILPATNVKQLILQKYPILVGTNVGMNVQIALVGFASGLTSVNFRVRIYFTRRRANAVELNQILLKRR